VRIAGEPASSAPLAERLRHYRVPAVSVAVMDSGKIVWARAWGVADEATGRAATAATLFQAASISKALTATVRA
jgi:CubicO group peptidase (beta-lactamase class C family)